MDPGHVMEYLVNVMAMGAASFEVHPNITLKYSFFFKKAMCTVCISFL